MKIKLIDLLYKIANGEEVPKEIRFDNTYWKRIYGKKCVYYLNDNDNDLFVYIFRKNLTFTLNDEVEIIVEDKKIEKIENETELYNYVEYGKRCDIDKVLYILKAINLTEEKIDNLNNKINELIDAVNFINKGDSNA